MRTAAFANILKCTVYALIRRQATSVFVLIVIVLPVVCASKPESALTSTSAKSAIYAYGVVHPYPANDWTETDGMARYGIVWSV